MQWDVEVQGLPLRKHLLENDQHGVWQGTQSPRCCPPSHISTFVLLTSHECITGVSSCKVAQALSWPRESRECPLNARVLSLKLPYRSKASHARYNGLDNILPAQQTISLDTGWLGLCVSKLPATTIHLQTHPQGPSC